MKGYESHSQDGQFYMSGKMVPISAIKEILDFYWHKYWRYL